MIELKSITACQHETRGLNDISLTINLGDSSGSPARSI